MKQFVALLRAVNVAGSSMIAMADLRDMLAELGFGQPRSLLQSGNLLFQSQEPSPRKLEALLERETAERFDLQTDYFVRTAHEWDKVIAANPFPKEAASDPGHLVVLALKKPPTINALEDLRAAIKGRESVEAVGKELFIVYPDGIGRSKLTNKLIEARLGTRATGRNWNTFLKIAEGCRGR